MSKFSLQTIKEAIRSLSASAFVALIPVASAFTSPRNVQPVPVPTQGQAQAAIDSVSTFLFNVLIALSVVFIIVAAFFYLTASGNQTQLDKAKNVLIYAVVAIVLALIAFSVPELVRNFIA